MRFLIALLALAGLVVSAMALRVHNQAPGEAPPCAVTEQFDCGAVNHSRFAVFPPRGFDEGAKSGRIHVPVAALGIAGYALMAGFAIVGRMWVVFELAQIGFFFAAMLTYLEAYVLEKWCIYCLWSQGLVTGILLLSGSLLLWRWVLERRGEPVPDGTSARVTTV